MYCAHDVEHTILRLGAQVGSPPRRFFNAVEARKVGREEHRIWRTMDLCLAVSPLDAAAMEAGGARRVELCPNGAQSVGRLPLRPLGVDEPLRLLFVGSGSYAPYERGIAWFVREVLPVFDRRSSRVRCRRHSAGASGAGRERPLRRHGPQCRALLRRRACRRRADV